MPAQPQVWKLIKEAPFRDLMRWSFSQWKSQPDGGVKNTTRLASDQPQPQAKPERTEGLEPSNKQRTNEPQIIFSQGSKKEKKTIQALFNF